MEEGKDKTNEIIQKIPKPLVLAIAGAIGCLIGSIVVEPINSFEPHSYIGVLAITIVWTAMMCFGLSLAIVLLQNLVMGKAGMTARQIGLVATGSAIAGVVSGGLAQILYSIFLAMTNNPILCELARTVAWTLMGGIMAFIMSFFIPNLNRFWAWMGGGGGRLRRSCHFYYHLSYYSSRVSTGRCAGHRLFYRTDGRID